MSFRITRGWSELGAGGRMVPHRMAEFGSVEDQLTYLKRMIETYRATGWAREKALQIIREAEVSDFKKARQAVAIAEWVQKNIRYVNELPETFQTPPRTVEIGAGDCDDHTTLIGSLCENLGIPIEVVGMKVNGRWAHVFPRAIVKGADGKPLTMPLDTTMQGTPITRFVDPISRVRAQGKKVETFIPADASELGGGIMGWLRGVLT